MIISAISEKGGPGKTTVLTNLAVYLHKEGKRVLLADLDPQRSTTTWSVLREQDEALDKIETVYIEGGSISTVLPALATSYDVVLVDTPGQDNEITREALLMSDQVLIMFAIGGVDFVHIEHTLDVVRFAQRHRFVYETDRAPLDARMVVNKTRVRSSSERMMRDALNAQIEDDPEISICSTSLRQLDDFQYAFMHGMGLLEYDERGAASKNFKALAREILEPKS